MIKEVYVINNNYEKIAVFMYEKDSKTVEEDRKNWVVENNLTKKFLSLIICFILQINSEKRAIAEYYEYRYMFVPIDCIEYKGYSYKSDMNLYYVDYDSKEYYKEPKIYEVEKSETDENIIVKENVLVYKQYGQYIINTEEYLKYLEYNTD